MIGFLQVRLQRLHPLGHLRQCIIQPNQITLGVAAQLCLIAELSLHGQNKLLSEILQGDRHGKAPIGADFHRVQTGGLFGGFHQGCTSIFPLQKVICENRHSGETAVGVGVCREGLHIRFQGFHLFLHFGDFSREGANQTVL